MGYSKEIYAAAAAEMERRRQAALDTVEMHAEQAQLKIPELADIKAEIAGYGADVIGAVLGSDNSSDFVAALAEKSLAAQERRRTLLKENGFPEDYLEPKFLCSVCEDTGYTDSGLCSCMKGLLTESALSEIEKYAPVSESRFDNFSLDYYSESLSSGAEPRKRMEMVYNYCKGYAADFSERSPSLFMHGATGLGKTHLSLAIAGEAVRKGFGVIYVSAPNLFSSLEREKFNRSTSADRYSEQEIIDAELLIIDDLGAEFTTQVTVSSLYNLINSRLLANKPTIISTNYTPKEFEEKYTQRVTSRITGSYVSLMFFGKDIRQIKRNRA